MRVGCGFFALILAAGNISPAPAQERRAPRIIAPELVAPPPVDPSTLNRLTPRAPLSELAGPAPEPEPEPKPADTLYFQPVAVAAGMVESEGHTIVIAGIRIVTPDRVCDAETGGVWPCGKLARTAFRSWLRGRALECQAGQAGEAAPDAPLQCTLAGYDVGKWLVENGWALAEPDGPYQDAAEAARETHKGIFSGGPSAS